MSEGNGKAIKKLAKTPKGYVLMKPEGGFAPGTPGGPGYPKGRPRKRDFVAEFIQELEAVEGENGGTTFLKHRWRDAFKDRSTASDMMSYLVPKPKPADHSEPPDFIFHQAEHVTIVQHADLNFGNGKSDG